MAGKRRARSGAGGVPPAGTFAEIHANHRAKIQGYLYRMTRDRALAEELTQETFLRVSRGLPSFKGKSKLSTWIFRIATNIYLDHRRREATRSPDGAALPPEAVEPTVRAPLAGSGPRLPDRLFEESEMGRCIREFVDRLPPDHASVIILHDLEGKRNAEIAQILDCSLDTVKIRVHRARQQLKTLLAEHCDFDYTDEDVMQCDRKKPDDR